MHHPVSLHVTTPPELRDRLTALVRPLLAIPHLLLVGGPAIGLLGGGYRAGVLGALAALIAVFDWFAILVRGSPIEGLQPLKRLYLGWRARVLAYCAFLSDEYPPFGEGPYPASLELPSEPSRRDRATVLLRPVLLIPHVIVLVFLLLAWVVVAVVSWGFLVVAARLPSSLWRFSRDVIAYSLRIEAYALLVHDEYPPFVLSTDAIESPAVPPEHANA